jgi:hypothetical protein
MARTKKITEFKSYPNWDLLRRPEGLRDEDIASRYLYLTTGKPDIYQQMIQSSRRKLIPESQWEELVRFAMYRAILKWDPDRDKKCPLKHYAWRHLNWVAAGWWLRNKHTILGTVSLGAIDGDILGVSDEGNSWL